MPLQATSGAASYDAFGGGVPAVPNYIEDFFRTHLYNGDTGGYIFASSGVSIVSGGMMWVKSRGSATNNYIFSPSLTNANYYLNTNTTAAQSNSGVTNNNFEAVDNGGGMRFGGAYSGISDSATGPYTSWTFRKQPKFFDVVTYTGNGTTQNIAHSLGSEPGCVIVKETSGSGNDWQVYHRATTNVCGRLRLNLTNAETTTGITATWGNNTSAVPPTSTVFTVGSSGAVNASGATYVAYLFAHDAGGFGLTGTDNVISCGSFTTNGSGQATVNLGYEPQWVLFKPSSTTGEWTLLDTMRGWVADGTNADKLLYANNSDAEAGAYNMGITATGFDTRANLGASQTHIYIAIRRGPMKVPTSGTSVFSPNASNAPANGTQVTTNFPVDLSIWKSRGGAYSGQFQDRLRGLPSTAGTGTATLYPDSTSAESSNQSGYQYWNTGFKTYSAENNIWWTFGRAPSFFDEVCYTGTGSATTVTHNLGAVPELIIVKIRDAGAGWYVYNKDLTSAGYYLLINSTAAQAFSNGLWNSTQPTSSSFTVGTGSGTNGNGSTYVAYLFATCAGVSKVGSYTGTGTLQTINCGFTGGARFVLIKRTDSTGDWYVWDSARGIVSGNDPYLLLNSTAAETTGTDYVDTYSAGFEISSTAPAAINASGGTFIFLAIA